MKDVLAYQLQTHQELLAAVQQLEAQALEMLRTNPFPVPNGNPDVTRILTEFTNNQVRDYMIMMIEGCNDWMHVWIYRWIDG